MTMDLGPVRRFVTQEFLGEDEPISDQEPLFSSGLLDSLTVVRLMQFLREQYGISLSASEVTLADFDTIERIGSLLRRKLGDVRS